MTLPRFACALAALMYLSAGVRAADFQPAIVYDMGGKFDRSFNQSAAEGVEKFKKDTGIAAREFEITNAAQREQAFTQLAAVAPRSSSAPASPRRRRLRRSRSSFRM